MKHQDPQYKCEEISDCSYSGQTLVEKRNFPDVNTTANDLNTIEDSVSDLENDEEGGDDRDDTELLAVQSRWCCFM